MINEKQTKSREILDNWEKEDFQLLDENFTYEEFELKEDNYSNFGKVTCKHCGKSYQWNEWGKVMKRQLRSAGRHLIKEHGFYDFGKSPLNLYFHFGKWCDKKSKEQYGDKQ